MTQAQAVQTTPDWIRRYARKFIWTSLFQFLPLFIIGALAGRMTGSGPPLLFWPITFAICVCATGIGERCGMVWRTSRQVRIAGMILVYAGALAAMVVTAIRFGLHTQQWHQALLGLASGLFFWNSFSFVSKFFHLTQDELDRIEKDVRLLMHPYW